MQTEQPMHNGSDSVGTKRTLLEELQYSVMPQVTGLLTDAELVVRNETRLLEARFFERARRFEVGMIFSLTGVGTLLIGFGLLVVTVVYLMRENFPGIPIWIVTGLICVVTFAVGAILLMASSDSKISKSE
jgi:hypothetical protein